MLAPKIQGQIIKKIFRIESGEFILATFEVTPVNGRLKARLIATEILPEAAFETTTAILPEVVNKVPTEFSYEPAFTDSYFSSNDLSFLVSQPTRAPAFQ